MKIIAGSILVFSILVAGLILRLPKNEAVPIENVSVVDGKQTVLIDAKGGYLPRLSVAKAGLPTRIVFNTRSTFDCSSAVTIPAIGYSKNLPPSGKTVVELPPQEKGTSLQGLCVMGMYNFVINFE